MKISHKDVELPAQYFESAYALEQAQKIVAIVTMTNTAASGNPKWVSDCVTKMILTLENSFNTTAATGGVRVQKYSIHGENFYQVSIDTCMTDNIYNILTA